MGKAWLKELLRGSVDGRQIVLLVFGEIYLLPFAANDTVPDLCGRFALLRLLVRIKRFVDAGAAPRPVAAGEAIKQTAMAVAAVAMAVARFLVQNFLHATRSRVGIENQLVCVDRRRHGRGKFALGRLRVESGHVLAWVLRAMIRARRLLLRLSRGKLREDQPRRGEQEECPDRQEFPRVIHGHLFLAD